MKKKLFCSIIFTALCCAQIFATDLAQYVNPFIGTQVGSGNTYPGAQVPFGMISWSPQTLEPNPGGYCPSGYNYNVNKICGFGLVHSSGVGCGATCELPFVPCTGDLDISPAANRNAYCSLFSHTNEIAAPGCYSVKLSTWKIDFEDTVKARSGIAHIDFPVTAKADLILNPNADGTGLRDGAIFIDPTNQTISGWAKSGGFCGISGSEYVVYFYAQFDRPFQSFGIWSNDQKTPGATSVSGKGLASYITFDCAKKQRVTMKVGISFVSIANAKLNMDTEIPKWDFSAVKNAARKDWNNCLSRIQIKGGAPEDTTIFYTALYHSLLLPSIFEDVNGQYLGMDNQVHTVAPGHHFLATFSGWDTYRTQAQLWGLLFPKMASDFCSSFLAMSQQTQKNGGGGLPLWSMFNDETLVMAGYPADPYIANAYAFDATNFDLAAIKKVMVDSGKNQLWCGRNLNYTWDHLPEYEKYGYYPADVTDSSVSKNVEFSVADFSIAQICKQTGDGENYNYFLKRSQSIFNLVNPAQGYMQRKNKDGKWVEPFDRFSGDGFMEGNSAQYTWTIPFNLNKLISMIGKEKSEAELDELTANLATGYAYQSKFYDAGNEPCFGVMPVYNWLQKPWKAQEKIRAVMLNCFHDKPAGIPGDDDSGAMSAWYIFNALGMYPEIPGVGGVTVLSPLFPKAVLNLPDGKKISITAKSASRDDKYIQSMTVNGKANSKLWLSVDELRKGATLKFVMGKSPNQNWGAAAEDAPPSFEPGSISTNSILMKHKITKRQFLITSASATAAMLAWEPLISICNAAPVSKPKPRRLKLNGGWQVSQVGKNDWIPATVPGCVHTDLLASKKIPDPFYRDNEKVVQWVGENDWIYQRTFDVPDGVLQNDKVLLRCEGLDTLAKIKINGTEIGRADNMFRLWEFDVKSVLRAGENEIEITFESPLTYIKAQEQSSDEAPHKFVKGRAWVRKEPCSFGWDWGPNLPSCGIWKNISLETFNQGRIADVLILQNHSGKSVSLDVEVNAEITGETKKPFHAALTVLHNGKSVAKRTIEIFGGKGRGELEIENPKLWWPNGMGEQPLYEVHVELLDANGKTIDATRKRIGLRELKIILPENGNPLQFAVNGVPFFVKGGNWIPCDSFTSRVTPEILRRYVADAAAVNMNFLRFWGGGYYEDDALFDACDEMGVCVWLDCKFACAAYPAFDEKFMDNVRREARDNLLRLRHHPCIAVWCGNNEIGLLNEAKEWRDNTMSAADYDKLFKQLIAGQVQEFAPQANYVSGSPDCGDTHYWEVWHGPKMFDAYRTLTGFMSEFGFQSFPELKTVRAFTNEEDRASVTSPVMNWHQRDGSGKGNEIIRDTTLRYFRPPKDFDSALRLSQILQGYGIKTGAEYWRQTMPKSMGCIFWQYNDIWPGMSWSSVDYFGRWKALHYLARKFYSPVLVSGLENAKDGTIELFVTNDLLESRHGKLNWNVTDLTGKTLTQDSMNVEIPSRQSEKVKTLNLQEPIQKVGANNLLTWLKLEIGGKVVSENLVLLALPKELKLLDPKLAASVKESGDGFLVTIKSENPALWVWLGLENADAKYADNFLHLMPDAPQTILVQPKQPLSKDDFIQQLQVRSLFDTYLPA